MSIQAHVCVLCLVYQSVCDDLILIQKHDNARLDVLNSKHNQMPFFHICDRAKVFIMRWSSFRFSIAPFFLTCPTLPLPRLRGTFHCVDASSALVEY